MSATGIVSVDVTVRLVPVRMTGDVIDEWSHNGWTECIAVAHNGHATHVTDYMIYHDITPSGPPLSPGDYVAVFKKAE